MHTLHTAFIPYVYIIYGHLTIPTLFYLYMNNIPTNTHTHLYTHIYTYTPIHTHIHTCR